MAERRMFTKKVTDSDAFISLSSSAQALYLHLCQSADDDGFNNQIQMSMYKAHASIDDVKVLLAKRFIIQFESGVIVIKHWRMHNALRGDRYKPTSFQDELALLKLKENKSYTLDDGCQTIAKWLPQDSIGKDSIGKDSIDKFSIDDKHTKHKHGEYNNVLFTDEEFEKLKTEFPDYKERIERLSAYMASTGKSYKNHLATIRNWARRDAPAKPVESTSFDMDEFSKRADALPTYSKE